MAALVSSSSSSSSKSSRLQQADNDDGGQSKPEGQTTNSIVVDTNPNDDDDDQQDSKAAIEQSKRGDKTTTTTEAANNNSSGVIYDVEHLATFSTSSSGDSRVSDRDGRATNVDRKANTTTDAKGPPVGHKLSQFQSTSSSSSSAATEADPITEPREALQKLFELEKLSGIWTQRMQIELREDLMLIVDCETNAIVERFHRLCVTKPEAFSHYNDIYNNIIVFIIQQRPTEGPTVENPGELHIFQCVTHKAQQLLADILAWKSSVATTTTTSETTTQPQTAATSSSKMAEQLSNETVASTETNNRKKAHDEDLKGEAEKQTVDSNKTTGQSGAPATQTSKPVVVTVASSASATDTLPIVNVNVKETVQVFNQIAALREKGKPNSPTTTTTTTTTTMASNQATGRPLSDASIASGQSGGERATSGGQLSSSGQLYKQRSIRATLAPATGDKSDKSDGQQAASTSSSSMTSSSEMTSNSSGQPTSCPADQQRPTNGTPNANGNQRAAATGANGNSNRSPPTGRPSGHHHHHQQQQSSSSSSSSSSAAAMAPAATQAQQHHNGATSNSNISKSSKSRLANGKNNNNNNNLQQQTSSSSSARTHDSPPTLMNQQQLEQVATNESYVSVLNHCFDDIEKFIIRLQQAAAALRELQAKRKLSKRSSISSQVNGGQPMAGGKLLGPPMTASEMAHLSARARGPAEDDYFEILSKFKLAFNLLAKLKGCIHEPNAPELVHFLFTPLAIIIDSARNVTPPIDPTLVGIPYLNKDALELLSNCCTSKESDMWLSLGPNWTQTIDINLLKASRLPSSFQPIFSDGWAPIITELELIGLVRPHQLPPPVQATHTNGTGSSNGHHQPAPADDVQQRRRASNLESEQTTTVDVVVEGGHYGTPRNGRSLHESLGSSNNRQVPVNGHRAPKKRSSPPMGYATANYAADLHEPFEEPADSYGYRVPGQYQSRYASAGPAGRPKSSSRRSAALGQPGDHFGSMVGPTTEPINELMLDGYLGSSDLLPSDDYTELHTGPDFYAPAMHNGHDHLAGPSHYRRSRQLQPRYSLPDNIGRPRRSGSSSMGAGYMQRPGQAYLDSAPGYEQPGSFNEAAHMTRVDEAERQAMLVDLGPAQTDWLLELQARQALIVRVLFTREANNDKELSVRQGEILEVLDDSRKWWKARNIELQVAHVPHTIVAVIEQYQTLDELLTNGGGGGDVNDHHSRHQAGAFVHQKLHHQRMHSNRRLDAAAAAAAQQVTDFNQNYGRKESKRNSKTAGAFRYF